MKNFNLEKWLEEIQTKILKKFKKRVLFIGLQGSYQREEATENSDVDVVVILDRLTLDDLKQYRVIVQSMSFSKKACGFISGESEISNWSKSDIFQFIYDTKPLYGDIRNIVSVPTKEDIKISVKTACENLYHATCHSFLYDENIKESLVELYKMTFFILQSEHFLRTNDYISTKLELIESLVDRDKVILDTCINRARILDMSEIEVQNLYERLLIWSSERIVV